MTKKNNNNKKKKKKDILLVLDLNGILFDRRRKTWNSNKSFLLPSDDKNNTNAKTPDKTTLGNFDVYNRPHMNEFIDFLLENFTCAVWSSVQKHNLEMLVDHAWGKERRKKLLFVWGQDECTSCGFFGDGSHKPVFLKETQRRIFWSHDKILLVDDSPYKALKNMQFTSIHPREWVASSGDDDELSENGKLRTYLEKVVEANASNVSLPRFIKQTPYNNSNDKNKEDEKEDEKLVHVMRLLSLSSTTPPR